MKLAISGKGGVGKTTIAAAMIKLFSGSNNIVYAIDADPDVCLGAAIGIPDNLISDLKPLVEMKDLIYAKTGGNGSFYTINPRVHDDLEKFCLLQGNIRYLRMGGVKTGGSACYCRENSFLHAVVSSLLTGKKDVVIMDMGAGIEHLSRGTARGVDFMLVVVEPSINSIKTAGLVKKLASDLGIEKTKIIGNKIKNDYEKDFVLNSFEKGEVIGFVGFDENIVKSNMDRSLTDLSIGSLMTGISNIHQNILREICT